MSSTNKKEMFRHDVQGLRAIAVLLVVLYHSGLNLIPGGYIGVDVFFVISGYLITGLLLRELEQTGRIQFMRFYGRRVRRLLPVVACVILTVMFVAWFLYPPLELKEFSSSAFATAVYMSNVWFASLATNYLGQDTTANPLLHTWSLAVEEQFYLAWPLFLWTLSCSVSTEKLGRRIFAGIFLVSAISLCGAIVLTRADQPWAFFGSPTRAWEFGFGAMIALLRTNPFSKDSIRIQASWTGMVLILIAAFVFTRVTTFPGIAALVPVLGTTLIIAASHKSVPLGVNRWLGQRPLTFVGDISYSLYLWHWPVFVFMALLAPAGNLIQRGIIGIVVSVGLACASYYCIENPVRFNRVLAESVALTFVLGIILSGFPATTSLVTRVIAGRGLGSSSQRHYIAAANDIPHDDCHLQIPSIEPKECIYGQKDSGFTAVLFGDSHAEQWLPALVGVARKEDWRLIPFTKAGCPSVTVEPYNLNIRRQYTECTAWRKRVFARITELRPQLIIISNYFDDISYRPDLTYTDRLKTWRTGLNSTLFQLTKDATTVAIIKDVPKPGFDVPMCLSRAKWQGLDAKKTCSFLLRNRQALAVASIEQDVSSQYPNVAYLDLTENICPQVPCTVERGNLILFHDSHHLTASFSKFLSGALESKIDSGIQNVSRVTRSAGLIVPHSPYHLPSKIFR